MVGKRFWALLAALAALSGVGLAQQGPDTDPVTFAGLASEGIYSGGPDSINLFNGQLLVPIPLGPSYPIGRKLRFQAMLVYNSRVWEFGHPATQNPSNSYTPVAGDPAVGVGWSFNLGAVKACAGNAVSPTYCYYAPDGAQHMFSINDTDRGSGYLKTNDATRLSLKYDSGSGHFWMWDEDGNKYVFGQHVIGYDDPSYPPIFSANFARGRNGWYLTSITDPFNNAVTIGYAPGKSAGGANQTPCWTPAGSMVCNTNTLSWIPATITLPGGGVITVTQDSRWRIGSVSFPGSGTWTLQYDQNPNGGTALYHNGILGDINLEVLSQIQLPSTLTGAPAYSFVYYYDETPTCTPAGLLKTITLPTGASIAYTYRAYSYYHTRVAWFPTSCNVHPPSVVGLTIAAAGEWSCTGQRPAPDLPPGNCNDGLDEDGFFEQNVQGVATRTVTWPTMATSKTTFWQYSFPYGEYGTDPTNNCDIFSRCGPETMTIVVFPEIDLNGGAAGSGHVTSKAFLYQLPTVAADNNFGKAGALIEERTFDNDAHIAPGTAQTITTPCSSAGPNQSFCSDKAVRVLRRGFDYGDGTNGGLRRDSSVTIFFSKTSPDGSCSSCPAHTVTAQQDSGQQWDGGPNGNGRHYNKLVHTLAVVGGGTRTEHTTWDSQISGSVYLPSIFTETKDTIGTALREDIFTFDNTTGCLGGTYVTDGTTAFTHCLYAGPQGGVAGELFDVTSTGSCPATLPSAGTDQHSFALSYFNVNTEPATATWKNGSGSANWNALDYTRDPNTGWITTVKDSGGFATTISRDAIGRPTKLTPPQPPSPAKVDALFFCYDLNKVMTYTADPTSSINCAVTSGSAGVDAWEQTDLDGLGRVVRVTRKMPDGTLAKTFSIYDARSNEIFTSAWVAAAASETVTPDKTAQCAFSGGSLSTKRPSAATGTYRLCFDPFGRAQQEVAADVSSVVTVDRTDGTAWYSDTKAVTMTHCVNAAISDPATLACAAGGLNPTTTMVIDAYGRPTSVTDEIGTTTAYTYDANNLPLTVAVGTQTTRQFTLHPSGVVESATTPEKGTVSYDSYGGLMNLRQKTEPGTLVTVRCWDFAGRLVSLRANDDGTSGLTCSNGRQYASYTYNNDTTGNAKSRVTQRVGSNFPFGREADVVEAFSYRAGDGRVSTRSITVGNGSESLTGVADSWDYDTLGALKSYNHPRNSGSFQESITTSLGIPTALTGAGQSVFSNAGYNAAGSLSGWTAGNSVVTTITQDATLRMRPGSISTSGATTNFASGTYAYDGAGNITGIGTTDTFKYDAGSRVISAKYSGVSTTCTDSAGNTLRNMCIGYDSYGNLTIIGGVITQSPSASATTNRLVSPATYTDSVGNDRGNLTGFTGETLAYDGFNRLVSDVTGTTTPPAWYYLYDASGERIARFVGSASVLRREMAKYLVQARGEGQSTLACNGSQSAHFTDVTCVDPDRGWIDKFFEDGITAGCGTGIFCPGSTTRRDQMAVFFVKARGEQPVANNLCNPNALRFTDVPCTYNDGLANGWGYIEQFAIDGITAGCGPSLFCPTTDTTEVQMVAFLNRSWNSYFPVPRGTTYSFRDLDGQVVTEYKSSAGGVSAPGSYPIAAVAARDNVFLGRLLVASKVSDTQAGVLGWYYYTSDHLGSPRLVTNSSHQTVESRKYWPYGQEDGLGNPVSLQSIRFGTMELDDDGQHYNDHARSYDLGTVRFLEPDPLLGAIEMPRTWNRYNYVLGNPVGLVDPRGYAAPFCYDVRNADNETFHQDCWSFPLSYGPGGGSSSNPDDTGGNGKKPRSCGAQRVVSFVKGTYHITLGSLEVTSAAALATVGPLGWIGTGYLAWGAAGDFAAGSAELVGSFTGNIAGTSRGAALVSSATTASGLATLFITSGDIEAASKAAAWEKVAMIGVNMALNGSPVDPEGSGLQQGAEGVDIFESIADVLGLNGLGPCSAP
jgi:RHS repeat-associated protein